MSCATAPPCCASAKRPYRPSSTRSTPSCTTPKPTSSSPRRSRASGRASAPTPSSSRSNSANRSSGCSSATCSSARTRSRSATRSPPRKATSRRVLHCVQVVKFNQFVFIDFLERLIDHHPDRKVHLIVDGHPSHRSKLVKAWVAEHGERIELHFLPGYSPDLNPVELLNHDVKANAVGRRRPRNLSELIDEGRSYLHGRQRQPHIIKRFFTHPATAYAA